jgi:uncharacterized repeat protein (TIGR02543 family)
VSFNKNGGDTEAVPATKTVTSPATSIDTLPTPPSRTSYSFGGWNTAANGTGSVFTASTTVSATITVYAQWNPIYTVSFDRNDGTATIYQTRSVTAPATTIDTLSSPYNTLPTPSRTGYSFDGWNTAANGTGSAFTASTTVSATLTVYAQWNPIYTVTFQSNYVWATKTVTAPATTIDALPTSPYRSGYSFGGWNTAANGTGSAFTASTTVSATITVYAQWNPIYTVSFDENDGTAIYLTRSVTAPATTIDTMPSPYNTLPSAYRSGYHLDGWNTAADGTGSAFTASTTVSTNITVYAQWTAETYTVTFRLNDGTLTVWATKTVTAPATTVTDFPADPSRTGYVFAGWNTISLGTGSAFTASTRVILDQRVYAQWNPVYTVSFNKNGGDTEAVPATKTVTSPATSIDALPTPPSRTGYIFTGWNTTANGSGSAFTASTTVSSSRTVYAQWNPVYTVSFNKNGGDTEAVPATKTVTSPATNIDTLPTPPSRTGYIFAGWNTISNGTGSAFTASTTVSASITVYAQWNPVYTVSFNKNGGDTEAVPATKTVVSPATSIDALPTPPTKTGYLFGGWNTAANGSGSAFDASTTVSNSLTVYAQWQIRITINPDAGDGAFSQGSFTLAKPSGYQIISITGSGYANPRWLVDGKLKGTGASITIAATDYSVGGHSLSLFVLRDGVEWSKSISFTVTN